MGYQNSQEIPININGTPIEWVNTYRYLGIVFDSKLSFTPLIKDLVTRMKARLNIMRTLAGTVKGAIVRALRQFYIQAIRSLVDYAAPILSIAPKSPEDHLHPTSRLTSPLQRVQNTALRTVLRAP